MQRHYTATALALSHIGTMWKAFILLLSLCHISNAANINSILSSANNADVERLLQCLDSGVQWKTSGKYVDNYYIGQTCWTEFKRAQALRVYDVVEKLPADKLKHFDIRTQHEMFDLVPETYSCDARFMTRIGPAYPIDGGKWICTDHIPAPDQPCTIFSLGSAGDFGFEDAVKKLVPHCTIHTFDCTGNWTNPSTIFHPWCLGEKDEEKMFVEKVYQPEAKKAVFKTWDTIMKEIQVQRVDVLKMDIEYFEWQVLPFLLDVPSDNLPIQILLEIHYDSNTYTFNQNWLNHNETSRNSAHSMVKLMKLLDRLGYRTARMEYNWYGGCCAEVVLIKDNYMLNDVLDVKSEEPSAAEPTIGSNFFVMFGVTSLICITVTYSARGWITQKNQGLVGDVGFKMFQRNYLAVYTLVMFADWLQGSYIYPLYREYGYSLNEISYLFVAGFLSSAVFGTFVGAVADHWGRKKLAIAFCFIYMISCFTKLSPNYTVLIFGRILAGIATSLLTSVFESWMVCEHFARNYDSAWLQTTFAMATFMNGVSAIGSGVIANFLVRPFGNVSPFILAAFTLLVPAIIMLRSWNENYGSHPQLSGDSKPSFWAVVLMIFSDRKIFAVGTIQFTFEAAMFCWIFLWSPVLEKAENTSNLPFGIIFATFMLAIMTGSMLYEILLAKGWSYGGILRMACALAAASFTACIILPINDLPSVYNFFFILFEFAVGLYYPSLSTIRSSVLPEKVRSTLLNIFRVPLNILVVLALINVDQIQQPFMFFGFAVLCIIATFMTKEVVMFGQNNGKTTTSNPDV